jgi:hypothetical protein
MWPPKRVFVLLAGVSILLTAATFVAESAYRTRFRRELAALERSIHTFHTFRSSRVDFVRFGNGVPSVEPSLREDVLEGLKVRLGRPSKLDGGDLPQPWLCGYYAVHFVMGHSDDTWPPTGCHVFIWSPRRLRFVHYMNEGKCPEFPSGTCPWRSNPRSTIANR